MFRSGQYSLNLPGLVPCVNVNAVQKQVAWHCPAEVGSMTLDLKNRWRTSAWWQGGLSELGYNPDNPACNAPDAAPLPASPGPSVQHHQQDFPELGWCTWQDVVESNGAVIWCVCVWVWVSEGCLLEVRSPMRASKAGQ